MEGGIEAGPVGGNPPIMLKKALATGEWMEAGAGMESSHWGGHTT